MTQPDLARRLTDLTEPLASFLGLSVWGVEAALGPRALVRVYVEGENGVDIDQCAELSRLLGLSLDVEDLIPGPYTLEISSPGLERIFFTEEQLAAFVGKRVEATLFAPQPEFPDRKKFRGTLTACADSRFSLAVEEVAPPCGQPPLLSFSFSEARKVKLLPDPPEKKLPGKKGAAQKHSEPVSREEIPRQEQAVEP